MEEAFTHSWTTADPLAQRCDQMGVTSLNVWHHIAFVLTGTTHRAN